MWVYASIQAHVSLFTHFGLTRWTKKKKKKRYETGITWHLLEMHFRYLSSFARLKILGESLVDWRRDVKWRRVLEKKRCQWRKSQVSVSAGDLTFPFVKIHYHSRPATLIHWNSDISLQGRKETEKEMEDVFWQYPSCNGCLDRIYLFCLVWFLCLMAFQLSWVI